MHQADRGLQVGVPEHDGVRVRTIDCGLADLTSADVESLDGGPIEVLALVEDGPAPPRPDLPVRSLLVRCGGRIYPMVVVEREADQPGGRRGIAVVHRDL